MYTENTVAATALSFYANQKSGSVDSADGSFADIFGARMRQGQGMSGNRSGFDAVMNRLAERFPNAKVRESIVDKSGKAATAESAKSTEEDDEADKTDAVNVDSSLVSQMASNSDLAKKVEDAISAFLDSAAGTNAMSGSYTQRSVTISITVVTYSVSSHSSSTGETLSSQDLQTSYQDVLKEKIQDLINKLFGVGESGSIEEETEETEETDETSKVESSDSSKTGTSSTKDDHNFWKSGFSSYQSFSMSLYYSKSMIQNYGNSGNDSLQNSSLQSLMFQASYQSSSAGFQSFADSILPQSIYNQTNQNNSLNGPFTSLLEGALGQMGLTSGGFSQTTDGFMFNVRNGRDFLSEFLEMAGWGKTPEVKEAEEVVEAADEAIAGTSQES